MTNHLTEEEQARILAYVDRALPSSELAEVGKWIDRNQEAKRFFEQLERSTIPFAEAMEPMLTLPIPESVTAQLDNKPARQSSGFWGRTVAAMVLLGVGVLIGNLSSGYRTASEDSIESWVAQVANYQQLYVRPTVDAADPVDRAALSSMITSNLERSLTIPNFDEEGVIFRRGQLLQVDGNPLIQLAYLPTNEGLPVAFCIMKDSTARASKPNSGISHGLNYQSWSQEGLRFVLLGSGPKQQIEKLAELARVQISAS